MKRTRDGEWSHDKRQSTSDSYLDGNLDIRWWYTEHDFLSRSYSKHFLSQCSGFFAGFIRNQEGTCDIRLYYPKSIIETVFLHIEGETVNLTSRQ